MLLNHDLQPSGFLQADWDEASDEASLYEVQKGDRAARNLFAYSILYLFAIFGVLAAEGLLRGYAL